MFVTCFGFNQFVFDKGVDLAREITDGVTCGFITIVINCLYNHVFLQTEKLCGKT